MSQRSNKGDKNKKKIHTLQSTDELINLTIGDNLNHNLAPLSRHGHSVYEKRTENGLRPSLEHFKPARRLNRVSDLLNADDLWHQ